MSEKNKQTGFIVISLMLLLFSVLKVVRGLNTSSDTVGGFWNYISLFYYVVVLFGVAKKRKYRLKSVFVAPLLYCLFTMTTTICISTLTLSTSKIYSYLMIPYFFLVFTSFYLFSCNSVKAELLILLAYFICLIISSFATLRYLFFGGNRAVASDIYYSLCLFPFALLFIKQNKWKNCVIVVQAFLIFLGNKRAGLIALFLGLFIYFVINIATYDSKNILKRFGRLILICAGVLVVFYISKYIDNRFSFGIYNRLNRIAVDEGSGRGHFYATLWSEIKTSNWFEIFFGHGMNTAGKVVGAGRAHNDFLQIIYDYGIIALLCIVVYYFSIIFQAIRMVIRKSPYASAFAVSVIIGLMLSMFSYFLIYYTFVTCIVAFWGYVIKMEEERLQNGQIHS